MIVRGSPIDKVVYLKVLELKTARLMAVSCLVGSLLAGGSTEVNSACESFGLHFGMAYQLIDDFNDGDSILDSQFDFLAAADSHLTSARQALNVMQESVYRTQLVNLSEFIST